MSAVLANAYVVFGKLAEKCDELHCCQEDINEYIIHCDFGIYVRDKDKGDLDYVFVPLCYSIRIPKPKNKCCEFHFTDVYMCKGVVIT